MPRPDLRIVILAIMTTMLASACQQMETEPLTSSGSAGSAALQLYLTDAPSDFMDSAEVTISRVQGNPEGPQGIRGWIFVPVIVDTDRSRTTLEPTS